MAYLILADGTVFKGKSIGAQGEIIGETVFTTGMTGYLETLTDPSYYGQIVTQTFPLMGNYGVIPEDFESKKSWVRGYIVREICDKPSNFRCEYNLDSFLKNQNIIGICGIDTRALTKKLRESGVMNGMIVSSDECPEITESLLSKIKSYKIEQAVETVSCSELGIRNAELGIDDGFIKYNSIAKTWPETNHNVYKIKKPVRIVLWDFGAKANIARELCKRGCEIITVPYDTSAKEITDINPDGIMLSNGPGDPSDNVGIIREINKLCEYNLRLSGESKGNSLPIFGICLGHQMLALARGAKTSKLKYGHRGGNHPVKNLETGRVYITSQNHGYAVEAQSLPSFAKMSFMNVNDGTCEGVKYCDIPAFSVQFHPEACGGPKDTNFLFDDFIKLMEK